MPDPVAWTFAPGGDYIEELAWLTDVAQAPTGGTQHRRLRQSPRTVIGFSALESGANRRWLELLLRQYGAAAWWCPVAIDTRWLTADVAIAATVLPIGAVAGARFAVGGRALLIGDDPRKYEVVQVDLVGTSTITLLSGLANGWPAGTQVVPLRRAHLAEPPQISRFTADDTGVVDLRFRLDEPLDTTAAMPGATYRSYPVFDAFVPVWTSDPAWTPERRVELLDDEMATPLVVDAAGVALGKQAMDHIVDTAADVGTLRAAIFALAGRWAPAWVPSWAHDLRLAASVSSGQGYIDVDGPLLSTQPLAANHRDIRIWLDSGTVLYRRITAVASQSATVDRLTLDATLPAAFTAAQVRMICFIALCVQDGDSNTLRYFDPQTMQCALTWRELDHEL